MTNIEFTNKFGLVFKTKSNNDEKITLYDYQKNILTELENTKFLAVLASRQMGLSTMITFHLTNWVINNKSDKNVFYLTSNKFENSIELLNKIRVIIDFYNNSNDDKLSYTINNRRKFTLNNGNSIKIISRPTPSITKNVYGIIIDNASFFHGTEEIYKYFLTFDLKQIILVSGFNKEYNFFYDELILKENTLKKIIIKWNQNPNYTEEWYNNISKLYCGNMCEVDLTRTSESHKETEKITKNRIINIRLNDEIITKISKKLIALDISLSEYIRGVINIDLKNDK